ATWIDRGRFERAGIQSPAQLVRIDLGQRRRELAHLLTDQHAGRPIAHVDLSDRGALGDQEVEWLVAAQARASERVVNGVPGLAEDDALARVGAAAIQ